MQTLSCSGVWQVLKRCRVTYKRGRQYVHSPDPEYEQKMERIAQIWQQVRQEPQRYVLLYEDELSYYRQPTLAQGFARTGSKGPLAVRSYQANRYRRIAGCINALTGSVFAWLRNRFDRTTLLHFFWAVENAYPQATTIFIVLDNWPVHFHADLLAGLQGTRIQLVRLPTYAPWENPMEKVWRKLYQEILHLHAHSDQLDVLQQRIANFLAAFEPPSPSLLRYVGLLTD